MFKKISKIIKWINYTVKFKHMRRKIRTLKKQVRRDILIILQNDCFLMRMCGNETWTPYCCARTHSVIQDSQKRLLDLLVYLEEITLGILKERPSVIGMTESGSTQYWLCAKIHQDRQWKQMMLYFLRVCSNVRKQRKDSYFNEWAMD